MTNVVNIIINIARILLFILGGLLLFWSFICFLGGPDGRIGTPESIGYGFLFLAIDGFIIYVGRRLGRISSKHRNV